MVPPGLNGADNAHVVDREVLGRARRGVDDEDAEYLISPWVVGPALLGLGGGPDRVGRIASHTLVCNRPVASNARLSVDRDGYKGREHQERKHDNPEHWKAFFHDHRGMRRPQYNVCGGCQDVPLFHPSLSSSCVGLLCRTRHKTRLRIEATRILPGLSSLSPV